VPEAYRELRQRRDLPALGRRLLVDATRRPAVVLALCQADVEDPEAFTLVLDASRLAPERIVDLLLAAAATRVPV